MRSKSVFPFLNIYFLPTFNCGKKNCSLIKESQEDISRYLKEQNFSVKSTEVMTVDGNGRVYFKQKNKKYQILSFILREGVKW